LQGPSRCPPGSQWSTCGIDRRQAVRSRLSGPRSAQWRRLRAPAEHPPFEHSRRCYRQNGVQAGIEPALTAGLITLVGSARPGHRVHTCAPSGARPKGGAPTVTSRGHHDRHVARHHARQGDVRIDGARVWSICTGLAKPTICLRIAGQAGLEVRLVSRMPSIEGRLCHGSCCGSAWERTTACLP